MVEDIAVNQMVAKGILEQAGMEVTIADDGSSALALVQPGCFDAVLMDIEMPGMDGFETTFHIREYLGESALPIIAMTAHAYDDDKKRILAAGMNDHVSKPTDPWVLFDTLERWICPRQGTEATEETAPEPEPGGAGEDAELAVPGIDTAAGLERFLGDRELYLEVMKNFRDRHADQVARIRQALANGDTPGARQLAHVVRGVAANVSALGVFAAASALEQALDEAQADAQLDVLVDTLERELAQVMSGFEGLRLA